MDYVKVPLSRIGALIGPKGETKKKIENLSGCEIKIDSNEGLIEIISKNKDDPLKNLQLISTAKAIGRGFTPDKAMQLLEMDAYLEIVDLRDYVGRSKKRLSIIRGRVIGFSYSRTYCFCNFRLGRIRSCQSSNIYGFSRIRARCSLQIFRKFQKAYSLKILDFYQTI